MRDAGFVKCCYGTLRHTVIFRIDYVEIFAAVDYRFHDLLSFRLVPGSRLLHNLRHLSGCELCVKSAGTSDLCVGTHSSLDVDNLVLRQIQGKEPLHSGIALCCHVGNNGCLVQALIDIDLAVEEINLNAGFLRLLQNFVPAGSLGCGDQKVINTVRDETVCRLKLLVVLLAVERLQIVAVRLGEDLLHVLNVRLAVTGLRRRVVYYTHFNLAVFFLILAASCKQTAQNEGCNQE